MSLTLNVSFTSDDPLNSTVVDDSTGQTLYYISTPFRFGTQVTTVRDAGKNVVATYEHRWGKDRVTFHGETTYVSQWLPKKSWLSNNRVLYVQNGRSYVWKPNLLSSSYKLLDTQNDTVAAQTHHRSFGLFSKRRVGINVHEELVPYLDAVILAFMICECERRVSATASRDPPTSPGAGGGY
ncbi:hypothetical protein L226DRAFT_534154 [Lentinus tigrinus ALCF2SS1-7]|uniref:DUF6593 domain-containing protein n=1 Tax=Lentinus tigrinus ALCF2SS1-6 TaxID=1328759 RepID=A0A5C2SD58_9APHY|nr:hypothetical protein L227DRAFT_574145 [Lentinus tigrinus ALCF2SS1-6]RPD76100.1 hypothetical protein L226DRAFT_534154 [Lentinus tigrinus ALCF2SS1-7]